MRGTPEDDLLAAIREVGENAVAQGFTLADGRPDVNRYIEHLHATDQVADPEEPGAEVFDA